MPRITKRKKFLRVVKRKLSKPLLYAVAVSLAIYIGISNAVVQKHRVEQTVPQFVISSISKDFDETEFMHLLLTIQEINRLPEASAELYEFANGPFPAGCPKLLTSRLQQMNWAPQAFLIRIKKLFTMLEVYERIRRLDETIGFLTAEIEEKRLPYELTPQINVLQEERNKIIGSEITPAEYDFIKEYRGIVLRLKKTQPSRSSEGSI